MLVGTRVSTAGGRRGEGGEEGKEGEGKVTWKRELNRIKKRYGLRVGAGREGGREVSVC